MAVISIPTSVAGVSLPGQLGQIAKGPLSALYGGKGVQTLKYPSDLATDATKNHYVQFSIKDVIPAGYFGGASKFTTPGQSINLSGIAQAAGALGGAISDGIKSVTASAASEGGLTGKALTATQEGIGQIADSATGKQFSEFGSTIGKYIPTSLQISPTTTQAKAYISLYMPDTLTAQYSADWQEMSLGDMGAGISTLRMIDQLATNAGQQGAFTSASNLGKSLGNLASTDPAVTATVASIMSASGIGSNLIDAKVIGDVVLKGQGYAINPQLQMIFRGVGFRSFQLSFMFTPKSLDESREVDNIIKTFKYHFSPGLQAGKTDSTQSMFLTSPSIFNVQFKIGQNENQYVPKYGDCVLSDIDVNYAPNGFAAHENGAPVQTTLNLTFKEIVIVDRDKISKGTLR
jgi:hypothetical protein